MQNCRENEKCARVCVRCAAECVARGDVVPLKALLSRGRLRGDLFFVPVNDLDLMGRRKQSIKSMKYSQKEKLRKAMIIQREQKYQANLEEMDPRKKTN